MKRNYRNSKKNPGGEKNVSLSSSSETRSVEFQAYSKLPVQLTAQLIWTLLNDDYFFAADRIL